MFLGWPLNPITHQEWRFKILCFKKKFVMFRKRSWFLCAGHSEAAKEATVTPVMDMDMDMDTDTVCGPEPG